MLVPQDRKFSRDHIWAQMIGDVVRIGLTDAAQDAIGEVVFVDLLAIGDEVGDGQRFGEIEGTKTVNEIYSPFRGIICAVNPSLTDQPRLLNTDPFGDGWIYEITPSNLDSFGQLLSADEYRDFLEG